MISIEQGKEFYEKRKLILSDAGFDLRKCVTNESKLQKIFNSLENSETKILNETFSKEQFGPIRSSILCAQTEVAHSTFGVTKMCFFE